MQSWRDPIYSPQGKFSERRQPLSNARRSDLGIEDVLRNTFVFRELLRGQVFVIVYDRVATLVGWVRDLEEKSLALATVRSLTLVTGINNLLRVERFSYSGSDTLLTARIRRRLATKANLDERDIQVEMAGGVVVLKGTVDNPVRKTLVESCVWEVEGVVAVCNDIDVDRSVIAGSIRESVDDISISGLIKTALLRASLIAGVTTIYGHVFLSGVAKDQGERTEIGAVAQSIRGVKWVRNDMTVGT